MKLVFFFFFFYLKRYYYSKLISKDGGNLPPEKLVCFVYTFAPFKTCEVKNFCISLLFVNLRVFATNWIHIVKICLKFGDIFLFFR